MTCNLCFHFGMSYVVIMQMCLKVKLSKLYNNKYMIASARTTKTETFAFIAILVFELFSCKVLLINSKNNRNC